MLRGCRMRRHLGEAAEMDVPAPLHTNCQRRRSCRACCPPLWCRETPFLTELESKK